MPSVGKTLMFPREDNIYTHKESIPYDEVQCKVWQDRPCIKKQDLFIEWKAYVILGFIVGTIAFGMAVVEEFLSDSIVEIMQHIIQKNLESGSAWGVYYGPWLFYAGCSGICGFIASLMTTYYGPGAAGSGVAEFIGFINGINYPGFLGIQTLITKVLGVTFAVTGKLCVGKEGPLAHIGAICGIMTLYVPGMNFECLRNDEKRRQLAAAGASTGVSVAFGSPIGGALFSYELSKPNTFWRFSMIWRVFLSCSFGTFFLAFLQNIKKGNLNGNWAGSTLKFGTAAGNSDVNVLKLLPGTIILGILGGMLGALFISVNTKMNEKVRKPYLTKAW